MKKQLFVQLHVIENVLIRECSKFLGHWNLSSFNEKSLFIFHVLRIGCMGVYLINIFVYLLASYNLLTF